MNESTPAPEVLGQLISPYRWAGPIRYIRQWLAIRRLNRLVAKQRDSFDCEDFRRRRAAALKHTPKVWG